MEHRPPLHTKDDVHAYVQHELERELAREIHKRKVWRAAEWITLGVLFVLALLQYLFIEAMYRALVRAEPQGRMLFRGTPPIRHDTRTSGAEWHAARVVVPRQAVSHDDHAAARDALTPDSVYPCRGSA